MKKEQRPPRRFAIRSRCGNLYGDIVADLTAGLGEIRCPTLLLHPDGSPFIPVPIMAELHRLLPDAELNVFGHARHGLPFSHAVQCSACLRDFLARRDARRG